MYSIFSLGVISLKSINTLFDGIFQQTNYLSPSSTLFVDELDSGTLLALLVEG